MNAKHGTIINKNDGTDKRSYSRYTRVVKLIRSTANGDGRLVAKAKTFLVSQYNSMLRQLNM